MARLALRSVSKRYGETFAVSSVTLEVHDRELFVIVGPSGSGKTTLLRLVAGLESSDGGGISIGDRDVTALPPQARNIGMVFQSFALFPHLSVRDNIAFGLVARRVASSEIARLVDDVTQRLGIAGLLDRPPWQLSGGEQQRVALARALVRHPDALLMDEPLSNLDAQLRTQTRAEIVRLQRSLGTTVLHVTHDQLEAMSMGDRIAVLRDGTLEQVGTPEEIYQRPATLFVGRFIGTPSMNVIPGTVSEGTLHAGPIRAACDGVAGDVVAGIRPEHVHVLGSRWSGHHDDEPTFPATVDLVERLGDQTLLTLRTADHVIVVRVEPSFHPAEGSAVEAWVDASHLHLFDPRSERAIEAGRA